MPILELITGVGDKVFPLAQMPFMWFLCATRTSVPRATLLEYLEKGQRLCIRDTRAPCVLLNK